MLNTYHSSNKHTQVHEDHGRQTTATAWHSARTCGTAHTKTNVVLEMHNKNNGKAQYAQNTAGTTHKAWWCTKTTCNPIYIYVYMILSDSVLL